MDINDQPIYSFSGEFEFLSNFYPCSVDYEGMTYDTVEAAYQASKTLDVNERYKIKGVPTPAIAKKLGRNVALRSDWDTYKLEAMELLLRYKFNKDDFRKLLLETNDRELIEGNWWGDVYWGKCKGVGHNYLGKLLMKVRRDLSIVQNLSEIVRQTNKLLHNPITGGNSAVIFDIDGTLANANHRLHHYPGNKKEFFSPDLVGKDAIIPEIVELLEMLHSTNYVLLVTSRKEALRETTENWFAQNKIRFDALLMRQDSDHRDDTEVKREILNNIIRPVFNPRMVFEDRSRVVKMWRSEGIKCLQVDDGDF